MLHDIHFYVPCLFCFFRQNNCWNYFAFRWTRLVQAVTWQVWKACPASLTMISVTTQSHAWIMVVMVSGLASSYQLLLVCITYVNCRLNSNSKHWPLNLKLDSTPWPEALNPNHELLNPNQMSLHIVLSHDKGCSEVGTRGTTFPCMFWCGNEFPYFFILVMVLDVISKRLH